MDLTPFGLTPFLDRISKERHHLLAADPAETCAGPAIVTGGCFRISRESGNCENYFLKPMAPGLRRSAELVLALVDTGNAAASGCQRMCPFFHGQPHGCLDHFNDQPALGVQAFVLRVIRHSENPFCHIRRVRIKLSKNFGFPETGKVHFRHYLFYNLSVRVSRELVNIGRIPRDSIQGQCQGAHERMRHAPV